MAKFTDRQQIPPRPPLYQTPRSRQPRAPADPLLQQRSWAALMLAILSLFGIMMMTGNVRRGVFVIVVALLIALAALWLAISAMSRARRGGTGRPRGAIFATILGTAGCLFSVSMLAGFAAYWPQITKYSDCLSGANTYTAQQACLQQFRHSLGNINLIGG